MSFRWAMALGLILAASGCRNRAAQELLERDLRIQEDIIYDLEDQVKCLLAENDALKQFAGGGAIESDLTAPSVVPSRTIREPAKTPSPEPAVPASEIPPLTPPKIEFNKSGKTPRFEGPPALVRPGDGFPEGELSLPPSHLAPPNLFPARPTSMQGDAGPAVAPPTNPARSEDVASITLDHKVTAGYDDDGRPGDDGVRVVVEPRNAEGQIIAAPAKISVVLMDPLLPGESARLGRWDFTADQSAQSYDKTAESEGMHLELPWYQAVPGHRELHMFVRYHTADGRKLDVDHSVTVALRPGQTAPIANSTPPRRGSSGPVQGPYGRPPSNAQRGPPSYAPPVARLLPPNFNPAGTPRTVPSRSGEPTPARPPAARAAETSIANPPVDDRRRTGAKWSPYR